MFDLALVAFPLAMPQCHYHGLPAGVAGRLVGKETGARLANSAPAAMQAVGSQESGEPFAKRHSRTRSHAPRLRFAHRHPVGPTPFRQVTKVGVQLDFAPLQAIWFESFLELGWKVGLKLRALR